MKKETYETIKELITALLFYLFLFSFFKTILFDYGSVEFKNLITNFSFPALKDFVEDNAFVIVICSSYVIIPIFEFWISTILNYLINIPIFDSCTTTILNYFFNILSSKDE